MIAPKLRFSEFKDEWQRKKIIEIADYVDYRGKTPTKTNTGILLVTAKNIKFGYLDYETSQEFINEDDFDEVMRRGKVKIDDVLITTEAPLGNVALVDREDIALAQRVIKYRGKENISNNRFLLQKFLGEKFQEILTSKATGGTVQGIKGSVLHQIEISLPSLKEQTKIAEFLSAVDDKISQLSRQLELLKQYKKGVMQKIFSQEIRFKNDNGEDFGEWEKHSLKVLLNKIVDNRGKTPETSLDEKIPLIEVNAIGNKSINYSKILKHVSNETYKTWFRSHIEENDVLFSTVGNTAMCSIFYGEKLACIAQNIVGLRANHQFITGDFLYYLLTEEKNNRLFKSIEMQAVQPSIKVSQMIDLVFNVPTIQEQEKIAEFLTAIDERIDHTTAQLTHTKQWKKGLLQQMFI